MKTYLSISICFLFLLFAACSQDTYSVSEDEKEEEKGNITYPEDPEEEIGKDIIEPSSEDLVENYTFSSSLSVSFSGTTATTGTIPDGVSINKNGAEVIITSTTEGVEYILSGTTTHGMLKIYSSYPFKITLNSVNITHPDGPAINIQSGKRAFIVLNAGTTNTLTDGSSYISATNNEDMKATLFSEGQIVFSGSGTLNVKGNYKHAICSDDYIRIREGCIINISGAVKDGIHTNDYLQMDGGVLSITAGSDGIECEEGPVEINGGKLNISSVDDGIAASYEGTDKAINPFIRINDGEIEISTSGQKGHALKSEGNLIVNGGKLTLKTGGPAAKGIKSNSNAVILGGEISIVTSGSAIYESGDISSATGIKCNGSLKLSDVNLSVSCSGSAGKGISCDGSLLIESGNISIKTTGKQFVYNRLDSSAKGIKSEGNLTVNGGNITISTMGGTGSEGMESKATLSINGGTIEIEAYDDGINASNAIVFSGGNTYSYSSNDDGVDSNGTLTISGGLIIASGSGSPEDGFDCDNNTFKITGGIVIGTGGSSSTPTSGVCTQRVVLYGSSASSNQLINIQSPEGENILTYKIARTYSQMTFLFSFPELEANKTYKIYKGGNISNATEFHGYYSGGSYSGGTQATTFTTNSMVTTEGNVSSNPGGGPGPGPRFSAFLLFNPYPDFFHGYIYTNNDNNHMNHHYGEQWRGPHPGKPGPPPPRPSSEHFPNGKISLTTS